MQLMGGFRVPFVAPGEVLSCNAFSISFNAASLPSCCGGVLLNPTDPAGTFIAIRILFVLSFCLLIVEDIGGHSVVTVASKSYFNVAITTNAPTFMYLYAIHVLPTLKLSKESPQYALVQEYLRHMYAYVSAYLAHKVPPAEELVMTSLIRMVKSPGAWVNVLQAIEPHL